jgi:hypothetical protein
MCLRHPSLYRANPELRGLFAPESDFVTAVVKAGVYDRHGLAYLASGGSSIFEILIKPLPLVAQSFFREITNDSATQQRLLHAGLRVAPDTPKRPLESLANGIRQWFITHPGHNEIRDMFIGGTPEHPELKVVRQRSKDQSRYEIACAHCNTTLSLGSDGNDLSSIKKHLNVALVKKRPADDQAQPSGSKGSSKRLAQSSIESFMVRMLYHFQFTDHLS